MPEQERNAPTDARSIRLRADSVGCRIMGRSSGELGPVGLERGGDIDRLEMRAGRTLHGGAAGRESRLSLNATDTIPASGALSMARHRQEVIAAPPCPERVGCGTGEAWS